MPFRSAITVIEMSEVFDIPKRAIEHEMKKLRDSERIRRERGTDMDIGR